MTQPLFKILIVEDSDSKYRSVCGVLDDVLGESAEHERATTVNEAERLLLTGQWSLVLLDVSMDISAGVADAGGRGHANLGGLKIAHKMFLKRREAPTIIVTAHGSFESEMRRGDGAQFVDLKVIEEQTKEYLGEYFVGHVRYGDQGWAQTLAALVRKAKGG